MEVGELPPFSLPNPSSDETAASLTFNASIILTTIIACLLLSFLVFLGPKAAEFLASKGKSARGNGSSHVDSHPTRSEINTNGPPASVNSRAYEKVHVLLLSWQGADPRFHKQLDELQNVFRDYYHYDVGASDVEDFLIPSDNSKNELDTKLSLFLRKDSSNSLLILYYGGHGNMSVDRRAIWKKWVRLTLLTCISISADTNCCGFQIRQGRSTGAMARPSNEILRKEFRHPHSD